MLYIYRTDLLLLLMKMFLLLVLVNVDEVDSWYVIVFQMMLLHRRHRHPAFLGIVCRRSKMESAIIEERTASGLFLHGGQ